MTLGMFVLIAVAGGVGAGLRYLADIVVTGRRGARFPRGILVVNVAGSFGLGLVSALAAGVLAPDVAAVLGTGLLGGFTTFSTVSVDTALLARDGETRRAWTNLVATALLCVTAAGIGLALGTAI